MEDKSIVIWAVVVLGVVLFVLLLIPISKPDILGQFGSSTPKFGQATSPSPSAAPVPTITELTAQRLRVGSGSAEVKAGDTITVHYKGAFTDGKIFDNSYERNQPFTVQIGTHQVIPGFEQGVIGMLMGEIRRLFIPANLAYGTQGQANVIPPNTPLIFDVELLKIVPAPVATEIPSPSPEESPTPTPGQ